VGSYRLSAPGSGQRSVTGTSEHGNELTGSIKGGEFFDCMIDCQPKKIFGPCN
jgi:hypothetical protein